MLYGTPDNSSSSRFQRSLAESNIILFDLQEVNTLLFLANELMEPSPLRERALDEDKNLFNELLAILKPKLKDATPKLGIKLAIEKLQVETNASESDIALAWQKVLMHCMQHCELAKLSNDVFPKFFKKIELLISNEPHSNPRLRMSSDTKIDDAFFIFNQETANLIFIEFLDELNYSRDSQLAKAIHNFILITRKITRCNERAVPNEEGDNKAIAFSSVASNYSALLFQALKIATSINNHDTRIEKAFFNQLFICWMQLPQFDKPFVEKYNALQLNHILRLINHFMVPNEPQIVKLSDSTGLLNTLTTELAPHLTLSLNYHILLQDIAKRMLSENVMFNGFSPREISLAWGHFLRFSFANSQLFDDENEALLNFHHGVAKIYSDAKKSQTEVTRYTDDNQPYFTKESQVIFKEKNAKKIFCKLMTHLIMNEQDIESYYAAQAIHIFLMIARKVALTEEQRNAGRGFNYVTTAGVGASLFQALKLEGKIDSKNPTLERAFIRGYCNTLLTLDSFDRAFEPGIYIGVKRSLVDAFRRINFSTSQHDSNASNSEMVPTVSDQIVSSLVNPASISPRAQIVPLLNDINTNSISTREKKHREHAKNIVSHSGKKKPTCPKLKIVIPLLSPEGLEELRNSQSEREKKQTPPLLPRAMSEDSKFTAPPKRKGSPPPELKITIPHLNEIASDSAKGSKTPREHTYTPYHQSKLVSPRIDRDEIPKGLNEEAKKRQDLESNEVTEKLIKSPRARINRK